MVLRLGFNSDGLYTSSYFGHIPFLHLHNHWKTEIRRLQWTQEDAEQSSLFRHWPLSADLHHPPILLLYGSIESCWTIDQSIRWWRWRFWTELAYWQACEGDLSWSEIIIIFLCHYLQLGILPGLWRANESWQNTTSCKRLLLG